MLRSFLWVLVAVLGLSLASARAEIFAYPSSDDAKFAIEVPDDWEPEVDEEGSLFAMSPDETGWVYGWIGHEGQSLEDVAEELDGALGNDFSDVNLGEPQVGTLNGMATILFEGSAVDGDSKEAVALRVLLFDATPETVGVVYTASYGDTPVEVKNTLVHILNSMQSAAAAKTE